MAELYLDPLSDISDIELSDTETGDSNLPTKSVWKSSQSRSEDSTASEPSNTNRSDGEIIEQSDTETVNGWSKSEKTTNVEQFLGNPGVNIYMNDPSDVTQVVSTLIRDDLIQLFAEQSNLYHRQNVDKWKISPKSLKWTDVTTA
jgi:hypothetical protein